MLYYTTVRQPLEEKEDGPIASIKWKVCLLLQYVTRSVCTSN